MDWLSSEDLKRGEGGNRPQGHCSTSEGVVIQIDLQTAWTHEILAYEPKKSEKAIGQGHTCGSHEGDGEAESCQVRKRAEFRSL